MRSVSRRTAGVALLIVAWVVGLPALIIALPLGNASGWLFDRANALLAAEEVPQHD